jgi:phospholipase/carboxylesterase
MVDCFADSNVIHTASAVIRYMQCLDSIKIETNQPVTASVIWLHGLGASGHDFESIIPELHLPDTLGVRFIFPHAPTMPVSINGGYVMPAWYDILDIKIDRKVDTIQLLASADAIQRLMDYEIESGIDSRRIILAGFSQGGAVAYQAALTYPKSIGGLIAMSTYFATSDSIEIHSANRSLPIKIFHGIDDLVVDESLAKSAMNKLSAAGLSPSYQSYPMAHSVCGEEVVAISHWMQHILSA